MNPHPAKKPVTKLVARFIDQTRWEDLPTPVVERTLVHILDTLGCAVFGSKLPWTCEVREYGAENARSGNATVIGGSRLAAEWAAFINGTAAHGFELDDYHTNALAHP